MSTLREPGGQPRWSVVTGLARADARADRRAAGQRAMVWVGPP